KDFSALDTDNDGSISMTEAAGDASLKAKFKALDKDNDGKLSRTEYEAAGAAGGTSSTKQ
ncbi:MAG TPA: EF-hand domain-containing protein, partial [Burkholderiaceae bacterium]|nr:EF-hand domain-containing protein [Burkholderiaceae bacterium]